MKKKLSEKQLTFLSVIASFIIPFFVMCVIYKLRHIAPFGDTSILIWDSKLQYKDYFGYLWDVLHGKASLEYSASKSLGGQTIGLVTYYLTCPLNLFVYFFKKSQIALFLSLETLIKTAFGGLTAAYFVRKRYNVSALWSVIISVCYALMEYAVVYGRNLMWLDGVVILPIACLGVYELLYNNKKLMLFFGVFIAIFSNWYAGFMVCLMTGFYFLFELVLKYDFKDVANLKKTILSAITDAVKVGADMVLGVLASGALLIPALTSLVGGKAKLDLFHRTINMGLLETFKGFAINANFNDRTAPLLYCGSIMLVLAVYFLFCKKEEVKLRICSAVYFFFMIFSFVFDELNIMWTAFVKSNSYCFRWSFTFGFLMLMLASMGVKSIYEKGIDRASALKALAAVVAVFAVVDINELFFSRFGAYATLFVIICYFIAVLVIGSLKDKKSLRALCVLIVLVLTVGELTVNGYHDFNKYKDSESNYATFVEQMEPVLNEIKEKDDSFYRLEKHSTYLNLVGRDVANSESFLLNYNGIENYTSTYDPNVDVFFGIMGYSDSTYVPDENSTDEVPFPTDVYWNSPLLVMDSILGIKYQILEKKTVGLKEVELEATVPMDMTVYENQYALPLAYNVSAAFDSEIIYDRNPFVNQEKFLDAILGKEANAYVNLDYTLQSYENKVETYTATAAVDGPLYFYTDGSDIHEELHNSNCSVFINGQHVQPVCRRFEMNAVYLGNFKKGDSITVGVKHYSSDNSEHNIYLAQLDMDAFEQAINEIKAASSTDLNIDGNKVSGTYTTDTASTVMITLPYTDGWSIYVDGKKVEYKELGNIFIGIDLDAGTHEISMVYSTLHKNAGIAASFVGFAGFAAWCCLDIILKKKKKAK